jgi:L-lactate utilization protein LutC
MRLYDFGIVILVAAVCAAVALAVAGVIVANSSEEQPRPVSAASAG